MSPLLRRVAVAALAALALFAAHAPLAAAADPPRCGHSQCAIRIKAAPASSVRISWAEWTAPPTAPFTTHEDLNRKTLALLEPGQSAADHELHVHGPHWLCAELHVHAVRVAGQGARVTVTAVLYDNSFPFVPKYLGSQELRTVTIASGDTVHLADTFRVVWDNQIGEVTTSLRLSNLYVPFYG